MTAPATTRPTVDQTCTHCGRPILFCTCGDALDWRGRALCRDADPELFFPVGTGDAARQQAEVAKSWCARCPVRVPCAQTHAAEEFGVFGGTTEDERRREREQERKRRTRAGKPNLGGRPRAARAQPATRPELIAAIRDHVRRLYTTARIAERLRCDEGLVRQVRQDMRRAS